MNFRNTQMSCVGCAARRLQGIDARRSRKPPPRRWRLSKLEPIQNFRYRPFAHCRDVAIDPGLCECTKAWIIPCAIAGQCRLRKVRTELSDKETPSHRPVNHSGGLPCYASFLARSCRRLSLVRRAKRQRTLKSIAESISLPLWAAMIATLPEARLILIEAHAEWSRYRFRDSWPRRLRPRNLTPDMETGLGGWTTEQIVTAMTTGVRPDGRVLCAVDAVENAFAADSEDATAIAAYLKSIPAVKHEIPGPFGEDEKPTVPVLTIVPPDATLPCQSRPRRNNTPPARKPSRRVPHRSVLPTVRRSSHFHTTS